jgi:hypothetical protein
MADYAERIAKLESSGDTQKTDISDIQARLRKLERLIYGVIGAAVMVSWVITQANNVTKLLNI